jgi:hypothetical protein
MTVETSVEVLGIKEALGELNTINKRLRRGITTEFRQIVQPLVEEAKVLVPKRAPMSGWNRAYSPFGNVGSRTNEQVLPWNPNAQMLIKPWVSGKRPRTVGGYTRNLAAFGVSWTDKSAVLFDFAGQWNTPQGEQMVKTLNQRYGKPSRAMWLAYRQAGPDIQQEIVELVQKVMTAVGRDIQVTR